MIEVKIIKTRELKYGDLFIPLSGVAGEEEEREGLEAALTQFPIVQLFIRGEMVFDEAEAILDLPVFHITF